MHILKSIFLFFFTTISIISYGQEHETILKAPDKWLSEILPFPLGFAQEIEFIGFEDLRFTPTWSDSTSQEFWTYMFVWYVEKGEPMTENKLTEYFNLYYDGLMGVDHNNRIDSTGTNQLDKTISLFVKSDIGFTGKMRVYDRFFTKDYMVLNIKVKESFCLSSNKQIIWCDISPAAFDHEIWNKFKEVSLAVKCE
jgi:hypothetical protein